MSFFVVVSLVIKSLQGFFCLSSFANLQDEALKLKVLINCSIWQGQKHSTLVLNT
jgi:hypothetical protein